MKSVVILSLVNLYRENSAAAVRMNNYSRALALAGVTVYLLPISNVNSRGLFEKVEDNVFLYQSETQVNPKGTSLFFFYRCINAIRKILKSVSGDVILLYYPTLSSLVLDYLILFFLRDYHIYCEVNEVRRFSSGFEHLSLKYRIKNFLLEKTYKWYNGVVFISKNIQDYFAKNVKNYIIIPILSDCSKEFIPTKGLASLDFVFVGKISFAKENLNELFEGFCIFSEDHPAACLKLYGGVGDKDQRLLNDYLKAKGEGCELKYMGEVEHSQVDEILSKAGAVILSRANNKQNYYGFSTKLSEYAVSGAPIIMTRTGVVGDFFTDRISCLMCEGYSRHSFLKKFEEFSSMSEVDKLNMAKNAFAVAKDNFDYRIYSKQLNEFLI